MIGTEKIISGEKNLSRACNLQDELFSALLGPQAKSSCQVWKRDVILKNVKLFLHMTNTSDLINLLNKFLAKK